MSIGLSDATLSHSQNSDIFSYVCGDKQVFLETGKLAKQAPGAVRISCGGTVVLCAATHAKSPSTYQGFVPLSVHFMSRNYAFGSIPGSYFRREGRPSEEDILISRLIDRSVRPLFPKGYCYETQLQCILLSHDKANLADVLAMTGSAAALLLAGIPLRAPTAGVRVGYVDGEFVINPVQEQIASSELDIVMSAVPGSINMIESTCAEISKPLMEQALRFGYQTLESVIRELESFVQAHQPPQWTLPLGGEEQDLIEKLEDMILSQLGREIDDYACTTDKKERQSQRETIKAALLASIVNPEEGLTEERLLAAFSEVLKKSMKNRIFKEGKRVDGRKPDEIRALSMEVDALPCVHGSAIFTRGNTQVLGTVTLGEPQNEQSVDHLGQESKHRYFLHYNFPSFATGELSIPRATSRREIGHGNLAKRSTQCAMPSSDTFPYTVRSVCEVLESDGSSSMATVCSTSLAMFDAGVPMKSHVAGIALGIVRQDDQFVVLTDILADEDHLGEMDFKIAGTENGITALQMDVKGRGLMDELDDVLDAGVRAKDFILARMKECIAEPRQSFKETAPVIITLKIDRSKVREVIGTSGKTIKSICEKTGAKINIEDDGTTHIIGGNMKEAKEARDIVDDIVLGPQEGEIYESRVAKIADFGVFVRFCCERQGLVHVSEIFPDNRGTQNRGGHSGVNLHDYFREGDLLRVKLLEIEGENRYRLTPAEDVVSLPKKQSTDDQSEQQDVADGENDQEESVSGDQSGKRRRFTTDRGMDNKPFKTGASSEEGSSAPRSHSSGSYGGRRPRRSDGGNTRGHTRGGGFSRSPRHSSSSRDGGRFDGNRFDGNRSEGGRFDGNRSDGGRSDGNRSEGGRFDGNRSDGSRSEGGRSSRGASSRSAPRKSSGNSSRYNNNKKLPRFF